MSTLVHCDAPDCPATMTPGIEETALSFPGWYELTPWRGPTRNFHTLACLEAWVRSVAPVRT